MNSLDWGDAPPPAPTCAHAKVMPKFDWDDVRENKLDAGQVRAKYPRFCGRCPDCGREMILYATSLHYFAGDW